jgi:hypothetical protein
VRVEPSGTKTDEAKTMITRLFLEKLTKSKRSKRAERKTDEGRSKVFLFYGGL